MGLLVGLGLIAILAGTVAVITEPEPSPKPANNIEKAIFKLTKYNQTNDIIIKELANNLRKLSELERQGSFTKSYKAKTFFIQDIKSLLDILDIDYNSITKSYPKNFSSHTIDTAIILVYKKSEELLKDVEAKKQQKRSVLIELLKDSFK